MVRIIAQRENVFFKNFFTSNAHGKKVANVNDTAPFKKVVEEEGSGNEWMVVAIDDTYLIFSFMVIGKMFTSFFV